MPASTSQRRTKPKVRRNSDVIDTFSALREVHEYSAENGPRFHTAAEMFILWEYDRSRHENITYDGIWFCRC